MVSRPGARKCTRCQAIALPPRRATRSNACRTVEELSRPDTSRFVMRKPKSTSEVSPDPATTRALEWCSPPPELSLPANAVHVWRADLGLEAAYLRRLEQNLSADERGRASRFRSARDRDRFIGARGLLREILALYLNASPGRLSFGYSAHGKPFLAGEEHSTLRFNVCRTLSMRCSSPSRICARSAWTSRACATTALPRRRSLKRFSLSRRSKLWPASVASTSARAFCDPGPVRRLTSMPMAGACRCRWSKSTSPLRKAGAQCWMRLRANGERAPAGSYERSRPSPATSPRWPPRAKTGISLSGNGRESRVPIRHESRRQSTRHAEGGRAQ